MSLFHQNLQTCPHPPRFFTPLRNPNFCLHLKPLPHFHKFSNPNSLKFHQIRHWQWQIRVFESDGTTSSTTSSESFTDSFNFDSFLSVLETFCLSVSAIVSFGCAANLAPKPLASRVLVWQGVLLVAAVAVGVVIRRRQWRRISGVSIKSGNGGRGGADIVERIEKLEEDLRSSATIIRVLSRQLEKLGIRFRVTRKALNEPIAETAALAQKNSEATRALAAQEDILEKELGEIQMVLLAMQEQQQKQLDLILAIGKSGKLLENKRETVKEHDRVGACNSAKEAPVKTEIRQTQAMPGQKGADNDKV
ncbi:hypothetical protein RJ641_011654 [Dillenia turbinata]|uniref:Uncharacterized protein n=1 Tax=Dillenia turbinata TaxID=194707 RepID=A0AAN8UWM1_9MAGN